MRCGHSRRAGVTVDVGGENEVAPAGGLTPKKGLFNPTRTDGTCTTAVLCRLWSVRLLFRLCFFGLRWCRSWSRTACLFRGDGIFRLCPINSIGLTVWMVKCHIYVLYVR